MRTELWRVGLALGLSAAVWGGVAAEGQAAGGSGCFSSGTGSVATGGCAAMAQQIEGMVAEPEVSRAHWGVAVAGLDGKAIYALNGAQYFQPASNTKLFTTAAAMDVLGAETTYETKVVARGRFLRGGRELRGALVLVGAGDANLSGRDLPYVPPALRPKLPAGAPKPPEPDQLRYLAELADKVAASGLKVVNGDIVGDDTVWPWEPYPQDWSLDDAVWGYGAPVSALTLGDNQMRLTVTPAKRVGRPAKVELTQAAPYYAVQASVVTAGAKSTAGGVQVERQPGSRVLRVYGQIAVDSEADVEELAVNDPAEYGAMALKALLKARGVAVRGKAVAAHRLPTEARGFLAIVRTPLVARDAEAAAATTAGSGAASGKGEERVLAVHVSPALAEDVVVTNKVSQNLHAELFLRQLGAKRAEGGTAAQGARVVRDLLVNRAGVDPEDFVFYDGSGLSGHDLVTPRATVRLLTWATAQPWFAAWKASLPVGGEDGTLAGRYGNGPLKDHLFAKTGTLGEARALSGYVDCASGRTVAFSVMVTDHAPGGHADQAMMDRIVEAIAAAN